MSSEAQAHDGTPTPSDSILIYATGKLRADIPDVSIEHEIAYVANHPLTDRRIPEPRLHEVLAKPENRYLARKVRWVFDLDCGGSAIIRPSDPSDVGLFTKALQARSQLRNAFEAIVGTATRRASDPLPEVLCDQVISVSLYDLVRSFVAPLDVPDTHFRRDALALARQLLVRANRFGVSDQQRALTFLMLRESIAYERFARHKATGQRLVQISVYEPPTTAERRLLDVSFVYEDSGGAMERDVIRVDVTQEFPFVSDDQRA